VIIDVDVVCVWFSVPGLSLRGQGEAGWDSAQQAVRLVATTTPRQNVSACAHVETLPQTFLATTFNIMYPTTRSRSRRARPRTSFWTHTSLSKPTMSGIEIVGDELGAIRWWLTHPNEYASLSLSPSTPMLTRYETTETIYFGNAPY